MKAPVMSDLRKFVWIGDLGDFIAEDSSVFHPIDFLYLFKEFCILYFISEISKFLRP